jgi:hypothetical protein
VGGGSVGATVGATVGAVVEVAVGSGVSVSVGGGVSVGSIVAVRRGVIVHVVRGSSASTSSASSSSGISSGHWGNEFVRSPPLSTLRVEHVPQQKPIPTITTTVDPTTAHTRCSTNALRNRSRIRERVILGLPIL